MMKNQNTTPGICSIAITAGVIPARAALIAALFCLLSVTPSAWATEGEASLTRPQPETIVTALKASHRGKKKHWYSLKGPKVYTYSTADGGTYETEQLITTVPDQRLHKDKHPVKVQVNRVRGVIVWCAPFWSLAYGVYTAVAK